MWRCTSALICIECPTTRAFRPSNARAPVVHMRALSAASSQSAAVAWNSIIILFTFRPLRRGWWRSECGLLSSSATTRTTRCSARCNSDFTRASYRLCGITPSHTRDTRSPHDAAAAIAYLSSMRAPLQVRSSGHANNANKRDILFTARPCVRVGLFFVCVLAADPAAAALRTLN